MDPEKKMEEKKHKSRRFSSKNMGSNNFQGRPDRQKSGYCSAKEGGMQSLKRKLAIYKNTKKAGSTQGGSGAKGKLRNLFTVKEARDGRTTAGEAIVKRKSNDPKRGVGKHGILCGY